MPLGAALSEGSSGENIIHFSAIRVRANGTSNLQVKVFSYDDVRSKQLAQIPVIQQNRKILTRLVNFMEQRASFEIKTTAIDEVFRINRITIFAKEVFGEYPQ